MKRPAFGGSLGLAGATPFPAGAHAVPSDAWKRGSLTEEVRPCPPANIAADPAVTRELIGHIKQLTKELAPPPAFRCGLWSDGVLEMQRNGVQVVALSQEEGETVAAFMARMREQLQPA